MRIMDGECELWEFAREVTRLLNGTLGKVKAHFIGTRSDWQNQSEATYRTDQSSSKKPGHSFEKIDW